MDSCAWVTHCLGDNGVEKAIVLGKSLRLVLTRKSLVTIVHPNISREQSTKLEAIFDLVVPLQGWKADSLKELVSEKLHQKDSFALSFALTSLDFFEKCIFLCHGTLILKNCDHLFETAGRSNDSAEKREGRNVHRAGSPLYITPFHNNFETLTDVLADSTKNQVDSDTKFLSWITSKQSADLFINLNGPYFSLVGLDDKQPLRDDDDLVIVNMTSLPNDLEELNRLELESAGLLERYVYSYWLKLYKDDGKLQPQSTLTAKRTARRTTGSNNEPIAIVGMSCRLPASNNINEFWDLLMKGGDGICNPPEDRFPKDQFPDLDGNGTKAGFLTVPVDEFDAKFFGISPKEAMHMDPQIRLLHEVVWEGLEDAGINPTNLQGTPAGVFLGSYQNEYVTILQNSGDAEVFRTWMGNAVSAGAARISHLLGLAGPSFGTNPACSASLAALHMAVQSLRQGECNMAITCAANLILLPFSHDAPGMGAITSPDGHCKTFDISADGFGRAEGVTVLILKRQSEAIRDGDRILALIRGAAIAQEGLSNSIGTPTAKCEATAMQGALRNGRVDPVEISYIEAHGTGTVVGDTTEILAISKVYGNVQREQPLVIGSVKTNVGHTESCSGITGIIKVILSMKNETIPRHMNFKELNPNINLESIPAQLPLEPIAWPKIPGKPRMAGINSFGFTGMDGHVIIQDVDDDDYHNQATIFPEFERPLHITKITAKTEEALEVLLEKYKLSLETGCAKFSDIAYTANVGRASFPYRAALVASNNVTAKSILDADEFIRTETDKSFGDTNVAICFLFTGQGSQYHGMAQQLYSTSPTFHSNFDYCDNFLKTKYGISIKDVFFGEEESKDVNRTLYSQTGIFVVEYCLLKLWESWGVKPDIVLGHSLGEFCAAVAAGILELDDALTLVAERSLLIENLQPGKMLVVKLDKSATESKVEIFKMVKYQGKDICLDIAAVNTPEQTVLAGDSEIIAEFEEFVKNNGGIKSSVLQSTHAFHSSHMDPMLEKYRVIAENIKSESSKNNCIFISGMLGKIANGIEVDADYWVRHTREKVNFLQASKVAYDEVGCRIFLEIGPHPVLSTMTMMNNNCDATSTLLLSSLRRIEPDWETILTSLAKLFVHGKCDINWEGFDQFYDRSKVGHLLPTYPFKRTKFWPKISAPRNIEIHPLLGSAIPNPTQSKLFQCEINLAKLEYLKDHEIGETIVFPGAGYMEMLLMAGHAASSTLPFPVEPISISNFKICAAMGLNDDKSVSCQTLVQHGKDNQDLGGFPVEMYRQGTSSSNSPTWIQQATAVFDDHTQNENIVQFYSDPKRNLENIDNLMTSPENSDMGRDLYDNVKQLGYNFGPSFKTLERLWRNHESNELLAEVRTPKRTDKYLLHPTLIDAMIQMALFQEKNFFDEGKSSKRFYVPTGCEKFTWFQPLKTELGYVHLNYTGKNPVVLFDSEGNLIAALFRATSVETRVSSIKALLEPQVKSRPDFFTVEWTPTFGQFQNRVDFSLTPGPAQIIPKELANFTDSSEAEQKKLISHYIVNALQKLGWKPVTGEIFCFLDSLSELKITPEHGKLVKQYLTYLVEDGTLANNGDDEWIVIVPPMMSANYLTPQEADTIMNKYHSQLGDPIPYEDVFLLLESIGTNLDGILTGKTSALEILFPGSESKPSVSKFYTGRYPKFMEICTGLWLAQLTMLKEIYAAKQIPLPTVRILEVGAGTGAATKIVLDAFNEAAIPFEYVYTDISASFFPTAEKQFEKNKSSMKFKKLNLEQDPTSQGFPPNYFDIVIGAQVVHATRDIRESLLNIKLLLRPGGYLWLIETLGADIVVDYIFGLIEGYWRFEDLELRPNHTMLTEEKWTGVLRDMGFPEVACTNYNKTGIIVSRVRLDDPPLSHQIVRSQFNPKMQMSLKEAERSWLVFYLEEEEEFVRNLENGFGRLDRKKLIYVQHNLSGSFNRKSSDQYEINPDDQEDMTKLFKAVYNQGGVACTPVEGIIVTWGITSTTKTDQTSFGKPFLHLLQNVIKLDVKPSPKVILLTSGQHPVGDITCSNPSSSTLLGIAQTTLNEHPEVKIKGIDLDPQQLNLGIDVVIQEMFSSLEDNPSHFTAYRGNVRYLPKFIPDTHDNKSLALPSGTNRFVLEHSKTRSIQDLKFVPLEQYNLASNDIELRVKCSGLNFKDIFSILKPCEEFETYNAIGLDFFGVVTRVGLDARKWNVGDTVCGYRVQGNAFPSHLQVHEDLVVEVPPNWTFAEAASLQLAFATAYHSLVNVAKAKKGESILIHAASGGVGLQAIQIAKHIGMTIICTAGSQRKRSYLRSLGIEHVFHSRTTEFEKEIMQVTQGQGVDVVLNSLTGPGFKEATLGACGHGARFLEISRLNIWAEEEVRTLRPDVEYTIVNIVTLDHASHHELINVQRKWIREGILKPVPYTRFDAVDIRQALIFLQKAQHVGKVVCTFPEPNMENRGRTISQLFNNESTYLITGGLGGIGMEVCKYMLGQGARHIVLLGRKSPDSATASILESLRTEWKCKIRVMQADIGIFSECQTIFNKISESLPPLRGVMHVAGTLADGLIENLTWDKFQFTYQAKVNGSWNLNELTKNMILEHFVLFSSFGSTLGSPGQANYTSACQFEDGLAHYRNSRGLTATTINWGQFGEVGMAVGANLPLVKEFTPEQGINALDEILRRNRNHITGATFNSSADFQLNMFPYTKWLFGDQVLNIFGKEKNAAGITTKVDKSRFGTDYDTCLNIAEKITAVSSILKSALIHILHLNTEEAIDTNMYFDEMGMDSLMMIEFQNFLQDILRDRLTLTQSAWSDCTTVNTLGKRLVEMIEGGSENPVEVAPTLDEVRELILKDVVLPERIQVEQPGSQVKPSLIKKILLTGSTGFMGSHMLIELLESCPQLEKIYCLVRKRQKITPEERLLSVLEKNAIPFNRTQFDKVVTPVIGNLTDLKMGLTEDIYLKLSEEVDAVIHFGAQVNQTEYYKVILGGKTGARNINVGGLLNVLEFACKTKTKHVFNASTIAAVLQPIEGDYFTEEWPDISALTVTTTSGYFASQYVCDTLLKAATTKRGIPCKSFRYTRAMGEIVMASSLSDQSLFTKLLLFALKEKVMPEKPIPVNIIPVGIAAKITVKIIFSDETPNEIYNVFHPRPHLLEECLEVIANEMSFSMTRIDHDEGREKILKSIRRAGDDDNFSNSEWTAEVLAEFENFFNDVNLFSFFSYANTLAGKFLQNQDFFVSRKLARFVPDLYCDMQSSLGILKKYMDKVKEEGLL